MLPCVLIVPPGRAPQGIPVVGTTLLPLAMLGIASSSKHVRLLLVGPCVVLVAALSLSAHKEYRFILPVLPVMAALAGAGLDTVKVRSLLLVLASAAAYTCGLWQNYELGSTPSSSWLRRRAVVVTLSVAIAVNGGLLAYFGGVHQVRRCSGSVATL